MDPQFPRIWKLNKAIAGSGPHHELNSHIIDLALTWSARISRVVGMEETFIKQRPAEAGSDTAVDHADGSGRRRHDGDRRRG